MENSTSVPIYYYPGQIMMVDDDKRYLTSLTFLVDETASCQIWDNPKNALTFLSNKYAPSFKLNEYLSTNINEARYGVGYHPLSLNVSSIYEKIYNSARFDDITVLIVDYAMPELNGIQFCQELQHFFIQKMMLTGEADLATAVTAFNKHIIDKFILKSDPQLEKTLNDSILELQLMFFQKITQLATQALAAESAHCLNDPEFSKVFYDIIKTNNIVEYYLIEDSGSFLMLDIEGNPSWFIVKSLEDIEMFVDFAKDSNAPYDLIQNLQDRKVIPYFSDPKKCHHVQGNEWESFCYNAQKIEGKEPYFYALVKEISDSKLDKDKVFSYSKYLESK